MYTQNGQNGQGTAVSIIQAIAVSVLFLVAAIGYSVYVLFELLSGFSGGSGIMDIMNSAMQMSGGYSSMDYGAVQALSGFMGGMTMFTTLITLLPAMVITAGIWLAFAAAKRNVLPGLASTGLTMVRIVVIVQLVFACIGLALVELICILVMVGVNTAASYYGSGGPATGIMILIMLVFAAVSAVQIIYYLKLSGTIKRMKTALITGQPDAQVSLYVEILCYINGALTVFGALGSLVSFSIFGFLADAGLATANICFAMLLRKYRNNMELLIRNPRQAYENLQRMAEDRQVQQPEAAPQQWAQQPQQAETAPQQWAQQPQQAETAPQQWAQQPQQAETAPQQWAQQPQQADAAPQQWAQQPQQAEAVPQQETAYGETEILPYYNETTVLSGQLVNNGMIQVVHLIRQKTGENICINKTQFWIGKDAGNVDYCITDNTAVSRRHALITIRNNECYILDNHSTNRVFVNGRVLEAGVDTPIANGDRIRMGDEEFTVSIG